MQNKKITIGLVAALIVSLCLNIYLYIGSQNSKETIAGLQASHSEKEQQLSELQEQLLAMTASLEASEGKISELTANLETAEAENEALTADLESAEAEIEAQEVAEVPTETPPVENTNPNVETKTQEEFTQDMSGVDYLASLGIVDNSAGVTNGSAHGDMGVGGQHYGDLQ